MNREMELFLQERNARVYTNASPGFDFLEDGEEWVYFSNPFHSEDMLIHLGGESSILVFGQWSQTFSNTDEGFKEMQDLISKIQDDRSYIWKAEIGGRSIVSLVNDEPGVFYEMAQTGFHTTINGQTVTIDPDKIEQSFIFWDPMMMEPVKNVFLN